MKPAHRFDPLVRKWIIYGLVLALVVGGIVFYVILAQGLNQIEYWKLALDAAKLIVTGFLVAYLGILIPRGFSEARDGFERFKEARIAFSRAKTGVDYLSLRLGVLSLKEASALIQQIHVWKHRAELYPEELAVFLRHRKDEIAPKQWADLLYEQLHAVRDALELHAESWDAMSASKRIAELHKAQEAGIRTWERDTGLKYPWPVAQPALQGTRDEAAPPELWR
jgi:hypothetical protein